MNFFIIFLFSSLCGLSLGYSKLPSKKIFIIKRTLNSESLSRELIRCETDEECQTFTLKSECISNHCECPTDTVLSSDASKCLPIVNEYGSSCEDNAQCFKLLSVGGVCDGNKCMCKTGYHYLKGLCWKNIDLHEKCFRNEQCFSAYEYIGLECKNNICKCRENYYERLGSSCRRKRKMNESCNLDDDCVDKTTCESMICSASGVVHKTEIIFSNTTLKSEKNLNYSKGTSEFNNKYVQELGLNCTNDSECKSIKNAVCLDNTICACKPVTYVASEDNKECLKVSRGKIDDISSSSCKKDSQCGVFGGNSFCENKRCACGDGTYFENKSKFCWKIKALKESCFDDRDCNPLDTFAECKETETGKFCTCKKGYHPKDSKCLLDALEVGEPCLSNDDCWFPNSFCNNANICTCKEGYYDKNRQCLPGIGSLCNTSSDCDHLHHAECKLESTHETSEKRCLCLEYYTASEDYKYCLQIKNFKENCVESIQCKFPGGDQGICKNNVCECREGEHYLNEKCYRSKYVKEPCSSKSECFPGNDTNSVICLKGFCSCNYDYELNNSKICVKTNSANTIKLYWKSLLPVVFFLTLKR